MNWFCDWKNVMGALVGQNEWMDGFVHYMRKHEFSMNRFRRMAIAHRILFVLLMNGAENEKAFTCQHNLVAMGLL